MVSHLATFDWSWVGYGIIILFIAIFFLKGLKIIRPTHRAAIETLGKYTRFQKSGITYVIPIKSCQMAYHIPPKDFAFLFFINKFFWF